MAKKVRIPTPLRKLTNDQEVVEVNATTIDEAIAELQARYPGFKERLLDDAGVVRRFVNVYVNEEDIRFLQNQQTKLKDGDEISIIRAIAGGSEQSTHYDSHREKNSPKEHRPRRPPKKPFVVNVSA